MVRFPSPLTLKSGAFGRDWKIGWISLQPVWMVALTIWADTVWCEVGCCIARGLIAGVVVYVVRQLIF